MVNRPARFYPGCPGVAGRGRRHLDRRGQVSRDARRTMVNKGSFFQRLKDRWSSGSGVRIEKTTELMQVSLNMASFCHYYAAPVL